MKAIRVVGYHQKLELQEAPIPEITSPLDVIVKIGAAGKLSYPSRPVPAKNQCAL